ncbi:MAG TPA: hypothetical protein PKD99_15755 [Sphingopyxis sp.]|mgnify:CR=1 FL=1|nr:hypothetical protein [Sphingopyxis sp.]HMP46554.1 hypothetical protein [Sphingopyxis sp.]
MRKTLAILAAGAALAAAPALAQLGGVADVQVGGRVGADAGVDPAATVGDVTTRTGDIVDRLDDRVGRTVDDASLTLATREQVRAGVEVRDAGGNSVGTVQSVEGDTAVLVRGGKLYTIPLSELWHDTSRAASGLVTKLTRTEIQARAAAGAGVRVD